MRARITMPVASILLTDVNHVFSGASSRGISSWRPPWRASIVRRSPPKREKGLRERERSYPDAHLSLSLSLSKSALVIRYSPSSYVNADHSLRRPAAALNDWDLLRGSRRGILSREKRCTLLHACAANTTAEMRERDCVCARAQPI